MPSTLKRFSEQEKKQFQSARRLMSYDEYLQEVGSSPRLHLRDAVTYLRDCMLHFGTEMVQGTQRFKLFDGFPSATGKRGAKLLGQERVQEDFFRTLEQFCQQGRVNRLIMLHGPNGSAKSTFAQCLFDALEVYSQKPEGALYAFSWIFPKHREGKSVGFGTLDTQESDSAGHLEEHQIESVIKSELREHPLLLLPLHIRLELFAQWGIEASSLPTVFIEGKLSKKNRDVFDAIWNSTRGDLEKVLGHIRVERFAISHRYRVAAATVGPQMSVDASERQISIDKNLIHLPASLASTSLFEITGELVQASGGLLEFADMLKRPMEAWKYLLLAIEEGEIPLPHSILPLQMVFIASSNDGHLAAFREHHEFKSFRGRMQLIRVPYLLNVRDEEEIYVHHVISTVTKHVAPHATYLLALWAVMTRLQRVSKGTDEHANHRSSILLGLAHGMSPLEKAKYYEKREVPQRFNNEEALLLQNGHGEIVKASDGQADGKYEGAVGASPRELLLVLQEAAQNTLYSYVSVHAVLAELEALCEKKSDYDFLNFPADGAYHNPEESVRTVHDEWMKLVEHDLRWASGWIQDDQAAKQFESYVTHVSYWIKQEKWVHPVTKKMMDPDESLMDEVESLIGLSVSKDTFRKDLIGKIAAFALDHPGEDIRVDVVCRQEILRLKEATYTRLKKELCVLAEAMIQGVSEEFKTGTAHAKQCMERLWEKGYNRDSARDALMAWLRFTNL